MKDEEVYLERLEGLVSQGTESQYFADLSLQVKEKCQNLGFKEQDIIATKLERLWLPVALESAQTRRKLDRTLIQGILGGSRYW